MSARSRKKRAAVAPERLARGPSSSAPLWMAAAIVIAGAVPFANAIDLPFVFDDHTSIVENAHIRQLWPLSEVLGAPVQSAVAGRPVIAWSLAINHAFGGLSPAGYHAWNLGVHLLAGLLLFGIVRRTLKAARFSGRLDAAADLLALASAVVWTVHPLQTEVVAYVTQRTESTMGLFYLLTLYSAIRAMTAGEGSRRWEVVAVAACVLGMASKESMATAPVMVLAYDATFCAGSLGTALRHRGRLYAGLALAWVVLAVLILPGPRSRSAGFASGVTPWTYLLNQPEMIVTYLRLSVWPVGQVLDYGMPREVPLSHVLPYAAIVVTIFIASVAAWMWNAPLAYLGAWFFVTLAPSSSFVPIATEVGAERRMYLPLAAIVVGIVVGGWTLLGRMPSVTRATDWGRWAPAVCAVAAYGVLATLSVRRNAEFATPTGIWQTVLERRPTGRAHYNLAIELKQQGRRDEAIGHYRLALADAPEAHYALGFELEVDGKHEEAIQHFQEFLRLKPDDQTAPLAYVLLGRALESVGRLDEAAAAFRREIQMRPRDVDGRAGLASVLINQQRFDEAIVVAQDLVGLDPRNAASHANLGIALVGRDRIEDAVKAFEQAVALAPQDADFRQNLANALAGVGRLDEAVIEYRRSLAIAPGNAGVHHALGTVFAAQGRSAEAIEELRRAAALLPDDSEIARDYAAMLSRRSPAQPPRFP